MKPGQDEKIAQRLCREARHTMLGVCQMSSLDLPDQRAIMLNISPRGMCCRAVYPPEPGSVATFLLGSFGEADGRICWVDRDRFGINFIEEVDCLAIRFAKKGFHSLDYDLPRSEAFESLLLSELFRAGELR